MSELTTQKAVQWVLKDYKLSMYALAKQLQINSIMISHYKAGHSKMGLATAKRFEAIYDIKISDASRPGRKTNEDSNQSNV